MTESNDLNKLNNINIERIDTNENDYNYNRETLTPKNKKLITIGNCSRFYFYILGSTLFKLFSFFLLGMESKDKKDVGLFGFIPVLYSYRSMQSIYTYLSYIIFGIIFHLCTKGKDKEDIKYIGEVLSVVYDKLMNQNKIKTNFLIILTSFCFAIYNEMQNLLFSFSFHEFDFWSFDILFTFLLMKKYFEVDVQKHHKCSIIFVTIICTILLAILSFLPNVVTGNLNQFEFVKEQLGSYFYSIIFILIFLLLSLIYSFSRNFSKVLIQSKFVSYYILIIFIGITGLITTIIISIISYFYERDNFISYFIELKDHTTWEILRDVIIVSPLYIFSQFMQIYFEILIIYYLNPIYTLVLNNVYFGTERLILFLFDIKMEYFANFILSEISEIVAIIGYIINLEIIELNFCGLSDNTRRNIMNKAQKEFKNLNEDNVEKYLDVNSNADAYIGIGKYEEMIEKRTNDD